MLHLSLLTLPRSSSRWRFLEPYQLHQLLWTAFPGLPRHSREGRFLYRHEENEKAHSVLVQSATAPDWSSVEDEADGTITRVKTFDPAVFSEGTRLRFLLRANPVVRRRGYPDGSGGDMQSRHIAVGSDRKRMSERLGMKLDEMPSREELLIEWLARKGADGGFAVMACMPGPNHDVELRRPDPEKRKDREKQREKPILLTTVEFEGILRVTDPIAFERTLRLGIGRGKGFGLGLLSVARCT